jgi:hypothetical protein
MDDPLQRTLVDVVRPPEAEHVPYALIGVSLQGRPRVTAGGCPTCSGFGERVGSEQLQPLFDDYDA